MLTPRADCVMVAPMEMPGKTESGLIIPEEAKNRTNQGTVKYKGSDVKLVEIGDHILFGGYTGTLIYVEGEGHLIIVPEAFISCIIHDDPIPVSGLYFRDADGEYFPATHEQAIYLCAKALAAHKLKFNANDKYNQLDSREGLRGRDVWR